MKNIFKTIFIILLLQCGGEVLGMNNESNNNIDNNNDGSNNNNSGWSVKTHTAIAILVWKLIPFPTWPDERNSGEDYSGWYVCYSRTFWQPQRLIFSRWDLKIGFFCFEHRTLEVIPKMFQAWSFKFFSSNDSNMDDIQLFEAFLCASLFLWPMSFPILTVKWKCLRMNCFSFLEILKLCVKDSCKKNTFNNWFLSPFFSRTAHANAKKKHYLLLFFSPQLSIDMSCFAEKDEGEKD